MGDVADKPLEEPYRISTPPASTIDPTSSPGTPIARSSLPSPFKSPEDKELPNALLFSATSLTFVLSCVRNWFAIGDVADRPFEEPYKTCTAPASTIEPKSSPPIPIARSSLPSPLKSPKER